MAITKKESIQFNHTIQVGDYVQNKYNGKLCKVVTSFHNFMYVVPVEKRERHKVLVYLYEDINFSELNGEAKCEK